MKCSWMCYVCLFVLGILFWFGSLFFLIVPYITVFSETLTYFTKEEYYVPLILAVVLFIFGYVSLYALHSIKPYTNTKEVREMEISKRKIQLEREIIEAEQSINKLKKPSSASGDLEKGEPRTSYEHKVEQIGNQNLNEEEYKHYTVAVKLLENEVGFNWQRLYCFLITNSILFAAWAIIFAQMNNPPKILLILISLLGLTFSILWRFEAIRGNNFHFFWLEKLREFEEKYFPESRRLFIQFENLTEGQKVKIREREIQITGIARLVGVGRFFVLLSEFFLAIYLLITVYSFLVPSFPWLFPN